ATGLRNTYDGVFHSNGNIYAPNNALGVIGTVPPVPRLGDPNDRNITTQFGENPIDNPGLQSDSLNLIVEGGYYGHPNPYRDEVVFNDGSFQGFNNNDADPSNDIPDGHPDYITPFFDLGKNRSGNGIIEYTADNFFGELQGDLLINNFSVGDNITRIELSDDGLSVLSSSSLYQGFADPLPIAMAENGSIFVGEFNGSQITVLEPLGKWRTDLPVAPKAVLDAGSATLDGKLYMVGGKTGTTHLNSMYIYDPGNPFISTDDVWTVAEDLPGEAVENPAVVSFDGKIYSFGGSQQPFSDSVSNAAVFDPLTSDWTTLEAMPTARGGATAQVLGDKIYVIGGMNSNGASLNTVEIYDPVTGIWETGESMLTSRDNAGSAVLDNPATEEYDELLYVFGGRTRNTDGSVVDGTLNTMEIYDPLANEWTFGMPMPTGRRAMGVGTLNGKIQVIGGEKAADGSTFDMNEEYNPFTGSWRSLPSVPTGRHGAAFGTIDDVIYIAAGGPTGGSAFTDAVEAFTF
ncbi:MAG: kelch repeat-containing protein, partial [Cyanobacteria bacterium J06632_19]